MRSFLRELRNRHVVKVGIAYLVVAWLVLQVADVIFPALGLPAWSIRFALALLALGFPAAVVLAWVFDFTPEGLRRTTGQEEAAAMGDPIGAEARTADKSIAVLPFPDMSAERDQEHFCDGLTEELLNVLTGIPGLRVASRTSSFAFKGKHADLPTIAAKLGVAHVLEGSVRKSGNTVRITVQLIEVASDSHLWSQTYDRELDDIFVIQDDIAARILNVLKLKLGAESLPEPTTQDARAYEYFLRARGYLMTFSEHDNERAIDLFGKATAADPQFLRAWCGLAEACAARAVYFGFRGEVREAAIRAGAMAMQIAPDHADSHLARGYAHFADNRFAEAREDFLQVARLAPQKFEAYYQLGRLAQNQGDVHQAIANFSRAMDLNPDDYESPLLVLGSFQKTGDAAQLRRYAEIGIQRARRHLQDYPDNPRPYYLGATALLVLDQPDEARRWAETALAIAPADRSTRYNVACFFALSGEPDKALDLLEHSILASSWIENDPELESLRDHPRYRALIESLKQA